MGSPNSLYADPWSQLPVQGSQLYDASALSNIGKADALSYMAANPGAGTAAGLPSTGTDFFSWDGIFGKKNADGSSSNGWGGAALGMLQSGLNAYMGMKQYGLAKDQLAFSKDSFNKNYAAQKSMTNSMLEDRQRARVASNSGAYQSVGDYMAKNGIT